MGDDRSERVEGARAGDRSAGGSYALQLVDRLCDAYGGFTADYVLYELTHRDACDLLRMVDKRSRARLEVEAALHGRELRDQSPIAGPRMSLIERMKRRGGHR